MRSTNMMKRTMIIMMAVVIATAFLFAGSLQSSYAGTVYSSRSAAGKYMIGKIYDHRSSISMTYRFAVSSSDSSAEINRKISALSRSIFDSALSESGIGDYIKYSVYNGYAVNWSYYPTGDGYVVCDFTYNMKYKISLAQERAFNAKLRSTMKSLHLNGKTNYKKTKIIYNWITKNVKYDYSSSGYAKYTAYAALNKKRAVCQGYSTLFYRMCRAAGVSARVITGYSYGDSHAWNIVKVGGKYYNLDATWDAGSSHHHYFLKSNKSFRSHKRAAAFTTASFNRTYKMASKNF